MPESQNFGPRPPSDGHEPSGGPGAKLARAFRLMVAGAVALGILALGYVIGRSSPQTQPSGAPASQPAEPAHVRYWSCSMHPQIHLPHEGKCPICFMDLIPVMETSTGGQTRGARLVLSRAARELAEIQTSPVCYRPLSVSVRMVGKIDFDETRLVHVSAWVPGRIDRLYVNFVGANIAKGEHLTYLYSPDLRTAQEEFLIANRRWEQARRAGGADEIASAQAARDAVEKKLQLWGILPGQVQELIRTGRGDDHMTIFAPMGGTVIAKEAFEGKYVQAGDRLFTIADLHSVWAVLEAYETDINWLRYGQGVQFEMDAYPGQVFRGRIAFISPTVNEATRTTRVRVSLLNADLRLKPGMYVRALVDAKLDQAGRVMAPEFAEKWMCPMHPEIVKDAPGKCAVCGMDLVESAKLGFGRPEVPARKVLSIPAAAPLLTGARAVVYVEEQKDGETAYVGRQVELGPRAGDYYIVVSGLQDGEMVVTRGNFKIDSALQIQARPSMMKPDYEPASAPATRPAERASNPGAPYKFKLNAARKPAPATGGSK